MESIGIDIGDYKTVLYTTKGRGMAISDELSKRNISTVVQLSKPRRKFGNLVKGERKADVVLRHRGFRDALLEEGNDMLDNASILQMFLGYLKKLIDSNASVTFSVPFYFKEKERRRLVNLAQIAGINVQSIVVDVTAVAVSHVIKKEKFNEKFVVLDLGHSKTTAGFFEADGELLKPEEILGVKLGAKNFDDKILSYLLKKYTELGENAVIREKLRNHINFIKTILNSTDEVSVKIEYIDECYDISLTKSEYLELIREDLDELRCFMKDLKDKCEGRGIEVIGDNQHNVYVKDMIAEILGEVSTYMNGSESAAYGAALACHISKNGLRNNFKIADLLNAEVTLKMMDSESSGVKLFDKSTLSPSNPFVVSYKRKEPFKLAFFSNEDMIAELEVKKEKTEELEHVKIDLQICNKGFIAINSIKIDNNDIPYDFRTLGFEDGIRKQIEDCEKVYLNLEKEQDQIGELRSITERSLHILYESLSFPCYNSLSERKSFVEEIKQEYSFTPVGKTLACEKNNSEEAYKKIEDIYDAMKKIFEQRKTDFETIVIQRLECFTKDKNVYTPTLYKMKGMIHIHKKNLKLEFDLNNILNLDNVFNHEQMVKEIETMECDILREIKEKEEEEIRKAEEEKRREKEEQEKKEKETKEAKNEDQKEVNEEEKKTEKEDKE